MGLLGIFAYLIAIFIGPEDFIPFMLGFPVVDYIASFTLFVGFMNLIRQKRFISLPQNYLIILFLFIVFLSNVVNNDQGKGIEQFIFFLKRAAIFFMFIFILNSSQQLKRTINFIVLLTIFLVISAIYQSISGFGFAGQTLVPGYEEIRVKWIGLWDGPNVLCFVFVIALPFALEFAFGPYSRLRRLINLFFSALLSYGVYLTNSRGGFIGFLFVIFFYFWNKFKNKKRYAVIIILLLFLFGMHLVPSRMSILNMEEESAHQREWYWEQGLSLLRNNPILGVGRGQFKKYSGISDSAHNNFVQNMAETGLIGLFLYVGLIYLSFKSLHSVQQIISNSKENIVLGSLTRGLFASMIGYNVTTFFVNMEFDPLFIWWGLCASSLNIARKEISNIPFKFSLKDVRNIILIMIVIIFIIYLVTKN